MVLNWVLLLNSLTLAGCVTLCALLGGSLLSLLALTLPVPAQRWLRILALVALALPPFAIANTWMDGFGSGGPWGHWLPFPLFSLPSAILLLTLVYWPVPFLLTFSVWRRCPAELLEQDPSLRNGPLIQRVLLPFAKPAITLSAVAVFALSLNQFTLPTLLQVKVLPAEIWVRYSSDLNVVAAFASAWPLLLFPLLLYLALRSCFHSWPTAEQSLSPAQWRLRLSSVTLRIPALCVGATVTIVSLVPLFHLLLDPKSWNAFSSAWRAGETARWNSLVQAMTVATVVLLVSAALGSMLLLSPGPQPLRGWRRPAQRFLTVGGWMAFGLPGIFLAIPALILHSTLALPVSLVLVALLAMSLKYFAVGWGSIQKGVQSADAELVSQHRLAGAGVWSMFRHVVWPQGRTLFLTAWYVIYVLVLWDVETGVLLQAPGGETLALRIFNLLHYGHNDQVNALSLHLLLLAVLPAALVGFWTLSRTWLLRHAQGGRAAFTLASVSLLSLTGCSPETGPAHSASPPELSIQSALFSRIQIHGSRGTSSGQFNKPRTVAAGGSNEWFVVDLTGRIQSFDASGRFQHLWQMPEIKKGKPKGMTTDAAGNLWVVEPHYQRINCFSRTGQLLHQWGREGQLPGELVLPRSITLSASGHVYVPEYTTVDRIQIFNTQGQYQFMFGQTGDKPGDFNRPEGIALDSQNRIYVADSCNHRIQIFDPQGRFLRTHGKAGSAHGEFSYPYDIKIDAQGRQYVCEFGNSRIQIFDASDHWIETLGSYGDRPDQFNNPWSIDLDRAGNLLVADAGNHRIVKYIRR